MGPRAGGPGGAPAAGAETTGPSSSTSKRTAFSPPPLLNGIGPYMDRIELADRGRIGGGSGTEELRSPAGARPVMARRSSKRVVYAALLGNILVALTKFAAAGFTGRAAMVSEAIHSLVDTGNEILLLYGLQRAARPA